MHDSVLRSRAGPTLIILLQPYHSGTLSMGAQTPFLADLAD